MSNYTPSGNPLNGARNLSESIRNEFKLIQTSVNSKSNTLGSSATSTTTMTIGLGVKTITVEANKEFFPGMSIYVADSVSPSVNKMIGIVTQYTPSTGLLRFDSQSIGGSGTKSSWVIGASTNTGVSLISNSFSGYQNFAQDTVASSATPNIWSLNGNQILLTGTANITGLAAAPQPGATRELICQDACSFTASTNMKISGVATGQTYIAHADDVIFVRATTTTDFLLTIQRWNGVPVGAVTQTKAVLTVGLGFGSTGTRIRRYTNIVTNTGEGTDWLVNQSSVYGDYITILRSGVYGVKAIDLTTVSSTWGISVNAASLNTGFTSLAVAERFATCANISNTSSGTSAVGYLTSASQLRVQFDSISVTNGANNQLFQIERIA